MTSVLMRKDVMYVVQPYYATKFYKKTFQPKRRADTGWSESPLFVDSGLERSNPQRGCPMAKDSPIEFVLRTAPGLTSLFWPPTWLSVIGNFIIHLNAHKIYENE